MEDNNPKGCKRCLLYEMADKAAYESVRSYLETVPASEKADKNLYEKRLAVCKECEFLLAGMCRKCGCYVEIRAALVASGCSAEKW